MSAPRRPCRRARARAAHTIRAPSAGAGESAVAAQCPGRARACTKRIPQSARKHERRGRRERIGDTHQVDISIAADELTGIAPRLAQELERRGHRTLAHGALNESERDDWAWASEAAARDVAEGRAQQAVDCCWTGTGASIAANKVRGVRAALCLDARSAVVARRWNDA